MWKLIAGILQLILLVLKWWGTGKPQRDTQNDRQDIVDGNTDAVSARIDRLLTKAVIVLNEARTVKLQEGEPAPWSGWLLTDGALTTLLEEVERCQ